MLKGCFNDNDNKITSSEELLNKIEKMKQHIKKLEEETSKKNLKTVKRDYQNALKRLLLLPIVGYLLGFTFISILQVIIFYITKNSSSSLTILQTLKICNIGGLSLASLNTIVAITSSLFYTRYYFNEKKKITNLTNLKSQLEELLSLNQNNIKETKNNVSNLQIKKYREETQEANIQKGDKSILSLTRKLHK